MTIRSYIFAAIVSGAMLVAAGCQAPKAGTPLTEKFGKDDPESQLEFWHELNSRPMTSNDDAFHGLLLYLDGKDSARNFEERAATLKDRKILSRQFNGAADDAITRGQLAVMIVRAIDVKGGLILSTIGPTPRYATRELQFQGIYPTSSSNQIFSGREYVGIIGRLEDYQRGDAADKRAAELPSESNSGK